MIMKRSYSLNFSKHTNPCMPFTLLN